MREELHKFKQRAFDQRPGCIDLDLKLFGDQQRLILRKKIVES